MTKKILSFISTITMLLLFFSCSDPCEDKNCNTGICIEGICDCPKNYYGLNCENMVVQLRLDNGETPMEIYQSGVSLDSIYDRKYEGGLIFYLDVDDELENINGLVASVFTMGVIASWGCDSIDTEVPNINSANPNLNSDIGTGATNTQLIMDSGCESGSAAEVCADYFGGYDDWFLPSIGELELMFNNLKSKKITGEHFDYDFFASSTEGAANTYWVKNFNNGWRIVLFKIYSSKIIPVRSF